MTHSEICSENGKIRLDARLQGRIFAWLDGMLLQRFDAKCAKNPDPQEFNNIGGNFLWPAPEGGPLGFNYPDGEWTVQPGVNTAASELLPGEYPACVRTVRLRNRGGASTAVEFRREIRPLFSSGSARKYGLRFTGYRELDSLTFSEPHPVSRAVIAAWSLEQFRASPGLVLFGKAASEADGALNCSYYGDPGDAVRCRGRVFQFRPNGKNRHQIGLRASSRPELIGAFDPSRELLILRTCGAGSGKRINIADNDQPDGVFSAEDQYSIFSGGPIGTFELETIAPMSLDEGGFAVGSSMTAESRFFRGSVPALDALLEYEFGMPANFLSGAI